VDHNRTDANVMKQRNVSRNFTPDPFIRQQAAREFDNKNTPPEKPDIGMGIKQWKYTIH